MLIGVLPSNPSKNEYWYQLDSRKTGTYRGVRSRKHEPLDPDTGRKTGKQMEVSQKTVRTMKIGSDRDDDEDQQ
ncbi:hypothetical protein LXL04_005743 [Taraxacum kok-saghyz]